MNNLPDTTEFDGQFIKMFRQIHGRDPDDQSMEQWWKGLQLIFSALSNLETHISVYAELTPAQRSHYFAKVLLNGLQRKVDKAWAFNWSWRKAAEYAESHLAPLVGDPSINERFTKLMKYARAEATMIGRTTG